MTRRNYRAPLLKLAAITTLALVAPTSLLAQTATTPAPRQTEYDWMSIAQWKEKHAANIEKAKKNRDADLVFIGDSIIEGWQWAPAWRRDLEEFEPVNLGIGGDKTENILWRLENGEKGRLDPKAVVLLIGTNNFGHRNESPDEVFQGVQANVKALLDAFPDAKLLCLAIFPSGEQPDTRERQRIHDANAKIATLRSERVKVLDLGHLFLEPDGTISKDVMADFLHPTQEGYERATNAILPTLNAWLAD